MALKKCNIYNKNQYSGGCINIIALEYFYYIHTSQPKPLLLLLIAGRIEDLKLFMYNIGHNGS